MKEKFKALEKYNFWKKNVLKLGFFRQNYLNSIDNYSENNLIKVLVGQRRTGKSYLLRQLANQFIEKGVNPINIFYTNKEFIDFVAHYSDLEQLV